MSESVTQVTDTSKFPERKVTILPDWRGDCDEPQVQVVRIHPNSRRASGFED